MPVTIDGSGTLTASGTSNVAYPGAVLQVRATRSGPARQDISSSVPVLVTGLSITFTPKRVGSLLIFNAQVSNNLPHVCSFGIFKNGLPTVDTTGYTNNNEANMQSTSYSGYDGTGYIYSLPLMHFETTDSLSTRIYGVYGTASWSGSNRTLMINNRSDNDMASFSYFTIMEVAQ